MRSTVFNSNAIKMFSHATKLCNINTNKTTETKEKKTAQSNYLLYNAIFFVAAYQQIYAEVRPKGVIISSPFGPITARTFLRQHSPERIN